MSLFRFKDSPQEIKTIVAHQVVRDCWPAEGRFYESNTVTEARVVKLRELSILNSIFTRPVQIGLFYRTTLEQGIKTTNFLLCIKSNPSLGTLVKVLDFPFGPS